MRPHLRCVRRMVLHPRHTEIAKLIVAEFRDQNILRLDIAVNDVPCLTEYQCLADILAKPDDFRLTEHALLRRHRRLLQRCEQLHPDKYLPADPILARYDCKIVAADNVRLALQVLHQLVFLYISLNLFLIRGFHTRLIVAVFIAGLDLCIIGRPGHDF